MVRLISRQRGRLAALKLTKLCGINEFPAANDSGKVLIIIKREETKIWILVDIFMKYTFLPFLMLCRHRSGDQNGPKFNIRSKSLLEPFSKNIFTRSCSLINSVIKSGHDYFFLKKCGRRKSN